MSGEPVAEVSWSPITIGSYTKITVVATADIPAASTAMNGTILIEDGGTGNGNLIIYTGGQRFRIDGGSAF